MQIPNTRTYLPLSNSDTDQIEIQSNFSLKQSSLFLLPDYRIGYRIGTDQDLNPNCGFQIKNKL